MPLDALAFAQFGLLDQPTVHAMEGARYRLLGSSLDKLSPRFRRLFGTALEDGGVTSGEMAASAGGGAREARRAAAGTGAVSARRHAPQLPAQG